MATTFVAQKYLSDNNEKLTKIQNEIKDIKDFQNNERRSKIDASLDPIESVISHMMEHGQGTFISDTKNRLTQIMDNNLAIKLHLEKDSDGICNQIGNIKFDSFMGRKNDKDIQIMIQQMKKWQEHYESYRLCCNVVMMIYAIFHAAGENKKLHTEELEKFANKTNKFISEKVTQLQKRLQQSHANAKGITNFESSELAYEALFDGCIENFQLHQQKLIQQLNQITTLTTTPIPFKAALLIENEKIQGGQFLLD